MGLTKHAVAFAAFAVAARALPQGLNFDQIAAAPTIASGPTANDDDGQQTATLYTSFTVTADVTASATQTTAANKARDLPELLARFMGATSTHSSTSSTKTSSSSKTTSCTKTTSSTSSSSTSTSASTSTTKSSSSTSTSVASTTSATTSSSSTSTSVASTTSATTSSVCTFTSPYISTNTGTPYYAALATSYTTDPALTATTTSGQACPTTPENGTYCGFINPEDPCAPQPDGYGPVPTPDTASAFLAYSSLHALASAAPTVISSQCNTEYQQVFQDLNGSVSAQSYIGLYDLEVYDATVCAAHCDATDLCTSFNIFSERDPSLNPSANDSTAATVWGYWCPNPPSMTTFKCTLWGSSIDSSLATNTGSYREQFEVVIAGSNGYDRTNATVPQDPTGSVTTSTATSTSVASSTTGTSSSSSTTSTSSATSTSSSSSGHPWNSGHNCNGKAIDASKYSMGSHFFPGPYNPQACSDYAIAQNAKNAQSGGSQCKMFNAVYLNKNGQPLGTNCVLYDSVLGDSYATYSGGKSGSDQYDCKQSWTWSLKA